jgi:hypothetical protein
MGLKFDGIGSGPGRRVNKRMRHPQATIMRLGHLGNDHTSPGTSG